MKKYLNKNNLKIKLLLPILLIGFLSFLFNSSAKTKSEYYKELFGKEFDFKIYESDKEKASKKDYFSTNPDKGYSLVLTSEIAGNGEIIAPEEVDETSVVKEEKEIKNDDLIKSSSWIQNKIILICDSDFSSDYPFKFNCSSESIYSNEVSGMGGFIRNLNFENVDIYVIPQNMLLELEQRSELQNYFKAIKKADKASETTEYNEEIQTNISILSRLKDFKDTMVFEFFSIAFYMIILAGLSWRFLSYLSKEDRKFSLNDLKNIPDLFKNLHLYQKIIIPVLFLMVSIYIPLVLLIGIKDGHGLNLSYLISYTKENFNISKLNEFSQTGGFLRIALFGYGLVFIGLFFLFFIPIFIKVFKRSSEKINEVRVKQEVFKYSLPILIIFSLIASSGLGVEVSIKFLIFVLAVLVFLFVKNLQVKGFDYVYSAKEKFVFTAVVVFIISVGFLFNFKAKDTDFEYKEEDLIGVTDKVVLLPYSKQLGENTLMNEYNFSGSEPVFVDNYLVYTPNNSRIENKNAKEFKNEGVFYIQNGDLEDIVLAINSNVSLSNELRSEDPSNFFKIKNFEKIYGGSEPEIQITFSCKRQDIGTDKIKVDFYYLSNGGEVEKENKTLFYFPGCSKIGEPETYKVKLEIPFTDSEFLFIRLVDVNGSDIKDIEIINGDQVYLPEYFSKGRGYEIIASGGLTTSAIVPITNYIFGDSYDLNFDLNLDEENKFDMSVPINELIKEEKVKDKFLIWSTKKYLPVRLPD